MIRNANIHYNNYLANLFRACAVINCRRHFTMIHSVKFKATKSTHLQSIDIPIQLHLSIAEIVTSIAHEK